MTAVAVKEVVCNKTSEFLNTNNESSETTEQSMKLVMAVDEDAMADTIETTELANGYTDLLNEKNCKDNYISDTVQSDTIQSDTAQSDTTSQYDTPRSENSSIPMEDAEDNFSLKLCLSDDDEEVEIDETAKCDSKLPVEIGELNHPDSDETTNKNKSNISEVTDESKTISEINPNLDGMAVNAELSKDKITNSGSNTIENQNTTTVNDILNDIENCLSDNIASSQKKNKTTSSDVINSENIEDTFPTDKTPNEKDVLENKSYIEISNVVSTQENNEKIDKQHAKKKSIPHIVEENINKKQDSKIEQKNVEENSPNVSKKARNNENKKLDDANISTIVDLIKVADSNITNNPESSDIQEKTRLTNTDCAESSNLQKLSETSKRKLDEELQESIESKKLKSEPIKTKAVPDEDIKLNKQATEQCKDEGDTKIKVDNDAIASKDEKAEIKKKLILRVLPLLFENEKIPNVSVEELILTKIIEGITQRTELAVLRQKAQTQEKIIDQLRKKATHLSKQLEDISTVTNRLTVDLQNKDRPVAPVKITRSVGLQVAMPTGIGKRYSNLTNSPNTIRKRPAPINTNSPTNNTSQSNANIANKTVKPTTPVSTNSSHTPSLLNKALTKPTAISRNTALVVQSTPTKPTESPSKQTKEKTSVDKPVTVDLTDEDLDSNKNNNAVISQNPPGLIPLTTGNLRVVSSLGNTMSTTSLTTQPQRVTYLMATPAVPGQNRQLLIATSAPTTGPRPALTVVGQSNVRGAQGTRYLVNTNGQQAIVQRPGIVLTNGQASNAVRVPVRVNNSANRTNALSNVNNRPANPTIHPAPLPILLNQPHLPTWRQIPPRPSLKISRTKDGGIQLSWSMPELDQKIHEEVASYQLYAYQEGTAPPSTDLWRKVGDVKALPLPMACTLTSFHPGNKYYFAVRAIDVHSRVSQFSYAQPISLHN